MNLHIICPQDSSVTLAVKVRDEDVFVNDHLTTLTASLSPVYRSKEESRWNRSTMIRDDFRMTYQFRMFCDAYFYTTSCTVNCKQQDSSSGHYTCDPTTGAKLCMKGWKGPNCADDINECEQGFCVRGECRNLPGDVQCICPANYTGKDCSELINPCKSSPCLNGGTCFAHSTQFAYLCTCKDGWEGKNCESRVDPCSKSPCSNSGTCTSQPGATSYECLCREPYYGANCLQVLTTTTSTTTTTTTTTKAPTTTTTSLPSTTTAATTTEPTTPATTSSTTTTSATTYKIEPTQSESSSESMVADSHRLESQEEGFQAWYIGIIVAAIVLASLVIVALIIFRRRRHNAKSQKEDLTCISPTGSNLVFQNNMYNNANRNNLAKEKCADRTSPSKVIVQSKDTHSPEPCASPTYVDMDDGGYCKIEDKLPRSSQNCESKRAVTLTNKAELNNYADFNTLRHQANQNQQET
ncbi:delta protein C isoform X1, partial [Biomphalaria glabrata]